MSDSNITKQALAKSLKELMAQKSFQKISIGDVVEHCGLTRQAFYYHFKDKYDLMNWIYYTEAAQFMNSYSVAEHWTDELKDLCYYMQENKVFYINALNTVGQNSFQEYLHDYIYHIASSVIEDMIGPDLDRKKWGFVAELFATAFVGLIVRWANRGMNEDPAQYLDQIRNIFDGSVLHELEKEKPGKEHE